MTTEAFTRNDTLMQRVWPGAGSRPAVGALAVLLGIGLLTASAKVNVPMWPVPMTMQSLVVLLIGMSYGARLAGATLLGYIAAGAVGLPVFAGTPERGLGLAYMAGPTGGYLVGFVIAAVAMGWLAERGWDKGFWRSVAAMTAGHVLLFVPGVAWLAVLMGMDKAIAAGLVPFLFGSVVKILLGAALMTAAWRGIARRQGFGL